MTVSVSVIIPTHNRAALLPRALGSVFAQSRAADEVIVVDDGSDDGTAALVARAFPEVCLITQCNHGVSHARNRGIDAARGEWLAFLDSDDEWLAHKIERQLAAIEREPGARVCHTDEVWMRRGRRVNPMEKHRKGGGRIFESCLPLCVISPSAVMLHRSVFDECGEFDESLEACEDYDLWLRVCVRLPVLYLPERLVVKHGGHQDQLSRRHWGMDRFRIRALEKLLRSTALTPVQARATLAQLCAKITVYLHGAVKRCKWAEAAAYESRRAYYARRLAALEVGAGSAPMRAEAGPACT